MRIILSIVFLSCINFLFSTGLSENISIIQNNAVITGQKGQYKLSNSPFEISIRGIEKDNAVYIFANYDAGFQKELKVPSKMKDISFFLPGTGMAVEINKKDGSIPLLLCGKYAHNHITEDRRIRRGPDIKININGIYEVDKNISGSKEIYLIFFVDRNKNESVDNGEAAFLKFKV